MIGVSKTKKISGDIWQDNLKYKTTIFSTFLFALVMLFAWSAICRCPIGIVNYCSPHRGAFPYVNNISLLNEIK